MRFCVFTVVHIFLYYITNISKMEPQNIPEVKTMKQDEKKENTWEIKDPKPPVIQSGHMENRRAN